MPNPRSGFRCPGGESVSGWLRRPYVVLSLLSLLTFVIYSGTLFFGFVWDDYPQIVNNPLIRSWRAIPRVFVSDLWFHSRANQIYYRPLFVTWSTFNYGLVGLAPWGWHLGGVLLHIAAVLALYWLARKLGSDYWTGVVAALVFALHPVHVECVAWVSAASDTMVTVFSIFAFIAFLHSREGDNKHRRYWSLAALGLLACALLTKEMAAGFALLVALYIWLFPRGQSQSKRQRAGEAMIAAVPYAAVTLAYLGARKFALNHMMGGLDPDHGLMDMMRTWPRVLSLDLRLLFMPLRLTGMYYTPYVMRVGIADFYLPLAGLVIFLLLVWFWVRRTGDRVVAFAALWIFVSLLPVLYLRNFGNGDFVRDRYLYLPSVGFAILAAKAVRSLRRIPILTAGSAQLGLAILVIVFYSAGCLSQQVYWASELLVYYRGHSLYPESEYATVGLAKELGRRGAYHQATNLLEEAIGQRPDDPMARYFLAEIYAREGEKEKARTTLNQAILVGTTHFQSPAGMIDIAGLLGRLGDYDRALDLCGLALAREPDLYSALYNCGNINFMTRRFDEAEKLLTRALEVGPDQPAPNYFLGRVLLETGRQAEAEARLRKAVALDPGIYDYHYWLGQSLEHRGELSGARQEYLQALKLNRDSVEARTRLAALPSRP